MKVKFYCNSGANIYSERSETYSLQDLGFTEEEWNNMTDDDKYREAESWANDHLEIGYVEIEDD